MVDLAYRMNILVVSREEPMLAQAREAYEEMGHRVLTATTAEEAISLMEGRDPALRNFIVVDQEGFTDATLAELLNHLAALDPPEAGSFQSRTFTVLMLAEGASPSSVPDEIRCSGICGRYMDSKEGWQWFLDSYFAPIKWESPLEAAKRNSVRNRIERMFGRLRASFGGRKHDDSGCE